MSVFVTNWRALFWAFCSLYLVERIRELRGTVGYVRDELVV